MENCKNPITQDDMPLRRFFDESNHRKVESVATESITDLYGVRLAKYDKLMEQRNNAVITWNAKNPEKLKSYKQKYYDANRIKIISNVVNNRSLDLEKKEKYRAYQKEYQKKHRERVKSQIAQNEGDMLENVD
jgi:hypothetical protein